MRISGLCCLGMILMLGVGSASFAQSVGKDDDWGAMGSISSKYDVKNVVSISGKILAVKRIPLAHRKGCFSLMIELDGSKEVLHAYLGPGSFLKKKGYSFEVGSNVVVTGSRATIKGKSLVIVKDLKVGDRLMQFRSEDGHHL